MDAHPKYFFDIQSSPEYVSDTITASTNWCAAAEGREQSGMMYENFVPFVTDKVCDVFGLFFKMPLSSKRQIMSCFLNLAFDKKLVVGPRTKGEPNVS